MANLRKKQQSILRTNIKGVEQYLTTCMHIKASNKAFYGRISTINFLIEILALLFISIITVFQWFKDPNIYMIYFVDEFFPFNPRFSVSHWIYAWQNYGTGWRPGLPFLPYIYAIYMFHNIFHFSLQLSQYVLYVVMFFATGTGMLLFTRAVYRGRFGELAPFISALIYMFNSYMLMNIVYQFMGVWWIYVSLPFSFLFIYRLATSNSSRDKLKWSGLLGIALYFTLSVVWAQIEPLLLLLFSYAVMVFLLQKRGFRELLCAIAFIFMCAVLYTFPSLYSLIPLVLEHQLTASGLGSLYSYLAGELWYNSLITNSLGSFVAEWLLWPKNMIVFSLILPIISAFSLLYNEDKRIRALIIYFVVILLLFVALDAGTYGLFGNLFWYLWQKTVFFKSFELLTFDFGFGIYFIYSILFPIGLFVMFKKMKKYSGMKSTLSVVVTLVIIVGSVTPMFTGSWGGWNQYWPTNPMYHHPRIQIPDYELTVYNYLSKSLNDSSIVLALPVTGGLTQTTQYYADPILGSMGIPIISDGYMAGPDSFIRFYINNQIVNNKTDNVIKELDALRVSYIMIRLDTPNSYADFWQQYHGLDHLLYTLNTTPGMTYDREIGERIFYRVVGVYPLIYAANLSEEFTNSTFLTEEVNAGWESPPPPPVDTPMMYRFPNEVPVPSSSPVIRYVEVSPVDYRVYVYNAKYPYLLVFSQTYDQSWVLTGISDGQYQHVMVYGYANGWVINRTGQEYVINIYYRYQNTYILLNLVILIGLLASVSLIVLSVLKKRPSAGNDLRPVGL